MNKLLFVVFLIIFSALNGNAQIQVVTSTTDLQSIADAIGGDKIQTSSIARGNQNIHSVEVLPSFMLRIKKANMYVKIGMGLDMWADPLIDGARNSELMIIDCSKEIDKLDVPTFKVDASHGDVHPYGNPHYWLDPANGAIIASQICDALCKLSPADAPFFNERLKQFKKLTEIKIAEWTKIMEPYKGAQVVVYHDDWRYFARAFGLDIVGFVEPKPGLEPTPSHLYKLINIIKSDNVKLIGYQPYFSDQAPKSLASQTGASAIKLATSVGCIEGVYTYFDVFDYNLKQIIAVLKSSN